MDEMKTNKDMSYSLNIKGRVFDIQRYCIHDGPGIRTLIFLKGCPLKCKWCCNPESQDYNKEIAIYNNKCIRCGTCTRVCPTGAIRLGENGPKIDRERCKKCGNCTEVCFTETLRLVGRDITVKETVDEIMKDISFFNRSGGGITVSGGEPLMQIDFLEALLQECKRQGLHTAIETTGYAKWESFERIIPFLDLVLFDIKKIDSEKHQELTGVRNELIHDNTRKLAKINGLKLVLRLPLIPNYNDSQDDINRVFEFARELGVKDLNILPYHRLGESKYDNIGKKYTMGKIDMPKDSDLQVYIDAGKQMGLNVTLHG